MKTAIEKAVVPAELRDATNWVCWRFHSRNGDKPTKVPFCTDGRRASVDDEETWSSFDVAIEAAGSFDGIGWTFSEDAGMVGIDLDDCLDDAGNVKPWAAPIVDSLDGSYAEVSPSGSGIKFWTRGRLPIEPDASGKRRTGGRRMVDAAGNMLSGKDKANAAGAIEMYDSRRFFTVTTRRWNGAPSTVADKSSVTTALWNRIFAERPKVNGSPVSPPAARPGRPDALERCRRYVAKMDPGISGQRGSDATFAAACVAFRFGLSDTEAMAVMSDYNARCVPPWSDRELDHKLSDAKADVQDKGEFGSMLDTERKPALPREDEPAEDIDADALDDELRAANLTDLGNAERFAAQHGDTARYVYGADHWLVWTGQRWQRDQSGEVIRLAARTARSIFIEASKSKTPRRVAEWALASESRPRLEAMLKLAESRPGIAVTPAELDRDAFAFNVVNGTVDLRTGELRKHNRDDLITRLAPVTFDAAAKCPRWLTFLDRIFNSDAELIGFVQRWCGHSLTGDVSEQYLPVFHGSGANGKSVLVDTLKHIMADYAAEAPPDLLTVSHQRGHPTEIADLFGRRLVVASETEDGAELRIQLMKRLTGDATLKGRFCHKDFFEFTRTHKLILVTNNRPCVKEQTEAVWRRLRLVPFNVVIPPSERDTHLLAKLKGEAAGILNWLVRGCLDWQAHGLGEPAAVIDATNGYQGESDPLASFAADCCEMHPDHWTSSAELRRAYEAHCEDGGDRPIGGRRFADTLKRYGCSPVSRNGTRGWLGIGLTVHVPYASSAK